MGERDEWIEIVEDVKRGLLRRIADMNADVVCCQAEVDKCNRALEILRRPEPPTPPEDRDCSWPNCDRNKRCVEGGKCVCRPTQGERP